MQWPDINSAGVMICGFILESEMPSLGSVRRAAEPVSVVTKSEMLTPVFAGGSLLRQPPWLWWRQLHREFLSCRRSEVIFEPVCLWPLAGQTSSGDILDKVDHGAGRSDVRMVPVEHLSRLVVILCSFGCGHFFTSQFFLSDEGEDVEMPLKTVYIPEGIRY